MNYKKIILRVSISMFVGGFCCASDEAPKQYVREFRNLFYCNRNSSSKYSVACNELIAEIYKSPIKKESFLVWIDSFLDDEGQQVNLFNQILRGNDKVVLINAPNIESFTDYWYMVGFPYMKRLRDIALVAKKDRCCCIIS